jgi:hypothetical protein
MWVPRTLAGASEETPVRSLVIRRALAFFLPVAVLATLVCGFVYTAVQQDLRMGANDPQLQLAEDAGHALDAGAPATTLVGSAKVDVAVSLAPFIVIFDAAGQVLVTDGQLDGHEPVPPLGVLDAARQDPPNAVTWEPRAGVRIASVTVPWRGGTVLAGRSLREVERQEDNIMLVAVAGWIVILGTLAVTALVAAWLWPR